MVRKLATTLAVPLRDQNALLQAAGFAGEYSETGLDDAHMPVVREALQLMLAQQDPFPGVVLDRRWNVVLTNRGADALLASFGGAERLAELSPEGQPNLVAFSFHERGLRPLLRNWSQIAPAMVERLRRDRDRTNDAALRTHYDGLIALAGPVAPVASERPTVELLPMIPLEIAVGEETLRLFTVMSTFGTPQDVTTDELRIETFYPLDAFSRSYCAGLLDDRGAPTLR